MSEATSRNEHCGLSRRDLALSLAKASLLFVTSVGAGAQSSSEDLDFLHGLDEYENIRRMLPDYMKQKAQALIELRKHSLDLSGPDALHQRGRFVRERILHAIGGLPQRTPLNARTTGTLERDGYRVEKVIFESQPEFYVTANLYLPASGYPPYPAVMKSLRRSP